MARAPMSMNPIGTGCGGVFRAGNSLILGCGWNERSENIRAKDLSSGKAVWSVPGGKETLGLCRGGDGLLYVLQRSVPNSRHHPA